jgi:hypothetical protein
LEEELKLMPEPENEHDEFATKILNNADTMLGYLPRYYAKEFSQLINNTQRRSV